MNKSYPCFLTWVRDSWIIPLLHSAYYCSNNNMWLCKDFHTWEDCGIVCTHTWTLQTRKLPKHKTAHFPLKQTFFSHDYKSGGEQVLSHLPLSSLVHFRLIYREILSGSSYTEPNHETPIYHLCLDAEKHKTNKISVSAFRSFSFYCLKWNVSFGSVTDHWILTSHSRFCTLFFLTSRWKKDRINVVKHF